MDISKIDQVDSPKFQLIVETASKLFMRYGVKRVTVEEICKTAKVSKMTFYKFFNHKIDLAEYIILSILKEGQNKFDSMVNQKIPFTDKMNQFFEFKMHYARKISSEFLKDFVHLSDTIHQKIAENGEKNHLLFIQMIKDAQKTGEVRSDVSITIINYFLNTFIEMRDNDEFIDLFDNVETVTSEMINFFFYGIMGKK